jgi:hypothetical protein
LHHPIYLLYGFVIIIMGLLGMTTARRVMDPQFLKTRSGVDAIEWQKKAKAYQRIFRFSFLTICVVVTLVAAFR